MHKTLWNKIIVDNFSVPRKAGITRHAQKSEHYAESIKLLFNGPYCLRQGRSKFGSSISSCHPMIQSWGSRVYWSQRERVGEGGSRERQGERCVWGWSGWEGRTLGGIRDWLNQDVISRNREERLWPATWNANPEMDRSFLINILIKTQQ